MEPKHPIQPLVKSDTGTIRFKPNAIVNFLLDHGGIDLYDITLGNFTREDREQFAQLIGYSWAGACDLSYMSSEVLDAAESTYKAGKTEDQARADVLRDQLAYAKNAMREGVAALYGIHTDDLS